MQKNKQIGAKRTQGPPVVKGVENKNNLENHINKEKGCVEAEINDPQRHGLCRGKSTEIGKSANGNKKSCRAHN